MNIEQFCRSLTLKELDDLRNVLLNGECTIDKLITENICSIRLINALRLYQNLYEVETIREIKKSLFKDMPKVGNLTLIELEYFARKYGILLDEI